MLLTPEESYEIQLDGFPPNWGLPIDEELSDWARVGCGFEPLLLCRHYAVSALSHTNGIRIFPLGEMGDSEFWSRGWRGSEGGAFMQCVPRLEPWNEGHEGLLKQWKDGDVYKKVDVYSVCGDR